MEPQIWVNCLLEAIRCENKACSVYRRLQRPLLKLLEIVGIIVVEDTVANNESGMVINNHDQVGAAGITVFGDVGKIIGIGLPETSKEFFFESFSVFDVKISGGFQVIFLIKRWNWQLKHPQE